MSFRSFTFAVAAIAAFTFLAARPLAQKPVSKSDSVSITSVIQAIDSGTRTVTLKNEDGSIDQVVCGPEVKRFDALKVGDKVTVRYYESLVSAIQKPGAAPPKPEATAVTRNTGAKPGGTIARQLTATVTIRSIDTKVPSVTVALDDGSTMSVKVEDRKNLNGLKAGDKVQITYTQALAISVESPR